jgi:hypothetical protein
MDAPLPALRSPFDLLGVYHISPTLVAGVLLAVVVLFWGVYTLVAIYHWVRYSHAAAIAVPAIGLHLVVSVIFILFAASGLFVI